MWAGFAAYLAVIVVAPRLGSRTVWALVALLVAAFVLSPVVLSHDVYSYVDYARLGARHGLDPYVHPPAAAPTDPAFAHVTWPDTTSAYGPLFTLLTYLLALLPVAIAVAALKLVAGLAVLGLAALTARLAAQRGLSPPRAIAFVALNPLVLVHVVGGAHNDALAMLLTLAGVAAIAVALEATAGVALIAALAVKLSAAFVAPFALLAELRPAARGGGPAPRPARFLAAAVLAAAAIALAAYLGFGWSWLHALGLAGENQGRTSHLSVPTTVARIVGLDEEGPRALALALYATLLAYLLAWTWRGGDWVRAAAWAGLGLLLATSWLLPWYLVLALPLAAVSRDRPLQALTLALTAFQLGARIPL